MENFEVRNERTSNYVKIYRTTGGVRSNIFRILFNDYVYHDRSHPDAPVRQYRCSGYVKLGRQRKARCKATFSLLENGRMELNQSLFEHASECQKGYIKSVRDEIETPAGYGNPNEIGDIVIRKYDASFPVLYSSLTQSASSPGRRPGETLARMSL